MSLRTKSRIPASTSETAARLPSTSSVDSTCSDRMVAFIGYSSVSLESERGRPPHDEVEVLPSVLPILTASGPICGNAGSFSGDRPGMANALPTPLEARVETLVGGAGRGFSDRAGDGDAVEQFLLGADLAQPSIVIRRQGLAGHKAGSGVDDAQFGRLVGLVAAQRTADDAGNRNDALLNQIVAVLQGERILLAER